MSESPSPLAHQRRALDEVLATNPRYLLHWDMGTGKTLTMLWWCERRPMKTVVLAPVATHRTAWLNDSTHVLGVHLRLAMGPKRAKVIAAATDRTVVVTSHESFRRDAALYVEHGFRRMIIDEADKIRGTIGKANATVAACATLADRCESVILLSGQLAPNGTWESFWPFRVMDPRVFGGSPWKFYGRYFFEQRARRNDVEYVKGFTLRPDTRAEYIEKLKSRAWVIRKEDVLDLPPQQDAVREIEMSADTAREYRRLEDSLVLVLKEEGESKRFKAGALLTKLRQLCGGIVRADGEAHRVHTEKLDWLIDDFIGGEYGPKPLVVWHEYTASGQAIVERLSELVGPDKVGWIHGGTSHRAGEIVAGFAAGGLRYVVAHPASAGHGTNGLQRVCSCAVYMDLSFSLGQHEQSRARIHRMGMGDRPAVYVYPLMTLPARVNADGEAERDATVDQAMLWVLRRKGAASKLILEAIRSIGQGGANVDPELAGIQI